MGRRGPFPCQGRSNRIGECSRGSLVARTQLPADATIVVRQLGACRTRSEMDFQLAPLLVSKLPVDERADKVSGIFTPHQCCPCGFAFDNTLSGSARARRNATIMVRGVAITMISVSGIPLFSRTTHVSRSIEESRARSAHCDRPSLNGLHHPRGSVQGSSACLQNVAPERHSNTMTARSDPP